VDFSVYIPSASVLDRCICYVVYAASDELNFTNFKGKMLNYSQSNKGEIFERQKYHQLKVFDGKKDLRKYYA